MCEYERTQVIWLNCGDYIKYDYSEGYCKHEYIGIIVGLTPTCKKIMFRTKEGVRILIDRDPDKVKRIEYRSRLEDFVIDPKAFVWRRTSEAN